MLNTVKTIYSGMISTCSELGVPYTPQALSTINEIWNIHHATPPGAGDRHKLEYIAIGNGGHRYVTGPDNIPYPSEIPHLGTHGGAYRFLPFIMRPATPGNDLSPVERSKYAMRALITVGGLQYWAYYLRHVSTVGVTPEPKITTIVNGVSTDAPFVPDNSTLTPTPIEIPSSGGTTTNGEFVTVSAPLTIVFSAEDIAELINVAEIIYGIPNLAIISEFMCVSAIRKSVSLLDTSLNPIVGNYDEALRAQVTSFVEAKYDAYANQGGFEVKLNVGVSDPLFNSSQMTVTPP